ncbi:uncharacterized protein V1513DRAFT_439945 [Lipomyces chichibuensis]|uniref:uncharacterized protein n=1 Tax=Lipomyces chichibuensis TaxID=1546026 RepID=UPI0033432593
MSIILSTGNVLHARNSGAQDLVSNLKRRVLQWVDGEQHPGPALSFAGPVKLEIPPNPREPLFLAESPERNTQVEITVKIFFPPASSIAARAKILERALTQFEATTPDYVTISHLVLSFPEITFSDHDDGEDLDEEDDSTIGSSISEQDIFDIWTVAVRTADCYKVRGVGVSEFSTARLEALIKFSKHMGLALPSINQINIRDCCVLPPSLLALAKENGVKLLAHNDALNILPEKSMLETVSLLMSENLIRTESKWSWEWLLKITGVVASRGVVCGLGWMVEFINVSDGI